MDLRMRHRTLLDWLDPSLPLMFLFGGDEGGDAERGGQVVGVSR